MKNANTYVAMEWQQRGCISIEVQFLGVVDHPNLVKLIGYSAMDGERVIQRLLDYEFMPNKSLEDHLFIKSSNEALPWQKSLQIMLGAAQGLAYLHEELETQVIFGYFKTSNILLDDDFNPKLSDFGLAREGATVTLDSKPAIHSLLQGK
ncbi:probable serine/threonine-protein kinase PBL19 [Rutidosis leptorrhynchoides]|uniref:probable serine/threonine-protein kinase PBL19 n=1 Tax=Rutidosis leptorrhynchoides TaxID=125765 RepID=UPI003A993BD8